MKFESRTLIVEGQEVKNSSPSKAIANGFGFLNTKSENGRLVSNFSLTDNISLPSIDNFVKTGMVDSKLEPVRCVNDPALTHQNDECPEFSQRAFWWKSAKSGFGGYRCRPKVLILDEPTRGVDVGAKREIYQLMNELAERGIAILMVSSDLPEVLGVSDRIIVLHEGKISGELSRQEATQEKIMTYATGGKLIWKKVV